MGCGASTATASASPTAVSTPATSPPGVGATATLAGGTKQDASDPAAPPPTTANAPNGNGNGNGTTTTANKADTSSEPASYSDSHGSHGSLARPISIPFNDPPSQSFNANTTSAADKGGGGGGGGAGPPPLPIRPAALEIPVPTTTPSSPTSPVRRTTPEVANAAKLAFAAREGGSNSNLFPGTTAEPLTPNGTQAQRPPSLRLVAPGGQPAAPSSAAAAAATAAAPKLSNLGLSTLLHRTRSNLGLLGSSDAPTPSPAPRTSELGPDGKKRLSRSSKHAIAHEHVRDVVTHVLGQKKDQDRAAVVPNLLDDILFAGVFDGHGRNGETRAELATTELPKLIKQQLVDAMAGKPRPWVYTEPIIHAAVEQAYAKFHHQLDSLYQEQVLQPAIEQKVKQIREERLSMRSIDSLESGNGGGGGGGGGTTTITASSSKDNLDNPDPFNDAAPSPQVLSPLLNPLATLPAAPPAGAAAALPFPQNPDEVNLRLPQDGGTTATSVIVAGSLIVVGWVGDSRAVLSRRIAKKKNILNRFSSRLKIATLTDDHNVSAGAEEDFARVAEQGGEIYGKHIAGNAIEGMLALTRSLGDSPFHRTGLVTSKPALVTVPIDDDSVDPLLFLLVASDGLWDYLSSEAAIKFVYKRLKKERYADERDPDRRAQMLIDTARALEDEVVRRATEKKGHMDDITVLLMTFSRGWSLEENEPTAPAPGTPNF